MNIKKGLTNACAGIGLGVLVVGFIIIGPTELDKLIIAFKLAMGW